MTTTYQDTVHLLARPRLTVSTFRSVKVQLLKELCERECIPIDRHPKRNRAIREDYINAILLWKKQAPTPSTNKEDVSTLIQSFLTRGMSTIIRCKLETLSEMCAHLGLAAVGSGKDGRVIRDDYLRALRDSTALTTNRRERHDSWDPCTPVPLVPDGVSPDVDMGLPPGTSQPVNMEVDDLTLLNNTAPDDCDVNPSASKIQAEDLDVDMMPAKTRVKRKKESKMEKTLQIEIHVYDTIHDHRPSLVKAVDCVAGVDLLTLGDRLGLNGPCRVIDPANRHTCSYINAHIPLEYLEYLYFNDHHGNHIQVTFNRRYNPKAKPYYGD